MYRTSLTAFTRLYQKTLRDSDASSSSGKRIDGLIQNLQVNHNQSLKGREQSAFKKVKCEN